MNQKVENPKMAALRLRLWQREANKQNLGIEEFINKITKQLS